VTPGRGRAPQRQRAAGDVYTEPAEPAGPAGPFASFASAHGSRILEEVNAAFAAQCACATDVCVHAQIRDLAMALFQPAIEAIAQRMPDLPNLPAEASALRHELIGALGELDGRRQNEQRLVERLTQIEEIFQHIAEVWICAQDFADKRGGSTKRLLRAIATARKTPPPPLFSVDDRAALAVARSTLKAAIALRAGSDEELPVGEQLALMRAIEVIERIVPPDPPETAS